jgi:hypothetical protein
MLTRHIVAGACALCLVVPALAGAQPAQDPPAGPTHHVVYGDSKGDLPGSISPAPAAKSSAARASSPTETADTGARLDHRGLTNTASVAHAREARGRLGRREHERLAHRRRRRGGSARRLRGGLDADAARSPSCPGFGGLVVRTDH